MSLYRPTARNFMEDSENRIHSDDIAKQLGFHGALVAGVAVFGHMTHPLVCALGADWLDGCTARLRLIKPAYDRDVLSIEHTETNREHLVRCTARGGTLLAELRSRPGIAPRSELSTRPGGVPIGERPVVTWDAIHENEAFPPWSWTPTAEENAASRIADRRFARAVPSRYRPPAADPEPGELGVLESLRAVCVAACRLGGRVPGAPDGR